MVLKSILMSDLANGIDMGAPRQEKRFVYVNNSNHPPTRHCNNKIVNTKYTLWTFLPLNLWEQFGRFMNKYFLLIACLQLWPLITPVNPVSTWGPLIFIFAVSSTKEAWDDYNRYVVDKKANEKGEWVLREGVKTSIQSQHINVGDVLWLRDNDEVPCDIVLLGTSEPGGVCHVETAALDGESDLKTRIAPAPCIGLAPDLLHKIKGVIECRPPDNDILRFEGNLRLYPPFTDNDICALTINNTLLQSCYLRYTKWACGVAVYTGNETKLGMSKGLPEPKLTAVDLLIDKMTRVIFVFQLVVVVLLGVAGNEWKFSEYSKLWYVKYPISSPWYEFVVIPLRFELLCSIMIPISIKVSLDIMKSLFSKFIDWDRQMYDEETDTPAVAQNTAINEDLGQIEYIISDKTGTLTENVMTLKKCFINGTSYSVGTNDTAESPLNRMVHERIPDVINFLKVMALCNTVIPLKSESGSMSYKSQSQDEEALVAAAARLQMSLVTRTDSLLEVNHLGDIIQFDVLDVLEFTSDRKKMSIVVREKKTKRLHLYSKGADESIFQTLRPDQNAKPTAEAVERYSHMGLRTLCLAWKDLTEQEYSEWSVKYKEASASLVDREAEVAEVCKLIEGNLEILGTTGVEDKLQDGVAQTIRTLRKAGINFWMLTGDKITTAVQIAFSCNLILPEPEGQLLHVQGRTRHEISSSLERVLSTLRTPGTEHKEYAFIIDGLTLEVALSFSCELFTELALISKTAICCRVTPAQKAQLVQLVKRCDHRTLAIGDGGNDVKMIQEAHVGVGISGREGLQAARASDFSIAKFRFLERMILIHGRYAYNRTALMAQYSIYKSLSLCFIQLLFSFFTGVSGTSLFDSFTLMAYNVIYTSVPIMTVVVDKDLKEKTVLRHPEIFSLCQGGRFLNALTFAGWFGRSVYHAIVVYFIAMQAYGNEKSVMEEVALVAFSGCIWLQMCVVSLEMHSFTYIQILAIVGNVIVFYLVNFAVDSVKISASYMIMFRLCVQPSYWLSILLMVAIGMGPIFALKSFRIFNRPNEINALQHSERRRSSTDSSCELESPDSPLGSFCKDESEKSDYGSVYEPLLYDTPSLSLTKEAAPDNHINHHHPSSQSENSLPLSHDHSRSELK